MSWHMQIVVFVCLVGLIGESLAQNGRQHNNDEDAKLYGYQLATTQSAPQKQPSSAASNSSRKRSREFSRLSGFGAKQRQQQLVEVRGPECLKMNCKPRHICVYFLNSTSNAIVCMKRSLFTLPRSTSRTHGSKLHKLVDLAANTTSQISVKLMKKAKKLKEQAREFGATLEKRHVHRLKELMSHFPAQSSTTVTSDAAAEVLASDARHKTVRDVSCRTKDINNVGQKLLSEFKKQQIDGATNGKHHKEKRNSTKKQLHDIDECMCQATASWEFQQLDTDVDGQLSDHEMTTVRDLYTGTSGSDIMARICADDFVNTCDRNSDGALSEKEWCCCFADVLPPCLAALSDVPSMLIHGQPSIVPGTFVADCDDDGFYKPVQCDSVSGQCWCVDHNGHKLNNTLTTPPGAALPSC